MELSSGMRSEGLRMKECVKLKLKSWAHVELQAKLKVELHNEPFDIGSFAGPFALDF